jgi:hypothetical protein
MEPDTILRASGATCGGGGSSGERLPRINGKTPKLASPRANQGIPLVHLSAQPDPFSSLKSTKTAQHVPQKLLRRQAKKQTRVSPWRQPPDVEVATLSEYVFDCLLTTAFLDASMIPLAAVLLRPPQHLQVPNREQQAEHVHSSHGQSCCRAHCHTCRCTPTAACAQGSLTIPAQVCTPHPHPFALAHAAAQLTGRTPECAAFVLYSLLAHPRVDSRELLTVRCIIRLGNISVRQDDKCSGTVVCAATTRLSAARRGEIISVLHNMLHIQHS